LHAVSRLYAATQASFGASTFKVMTAPVLPHRSQGLLDNSANALTAAEKYVSRKQWEHVHLIAGRMNPPS
jgi:hypothetical protein